MLCATEDSSVVVSVGGNVFHQSDHTAWEQSLYSADRQGVRDGIVFDVDVLVEERLQILACEESLRSFVGVDTIPDDLFLAGCGEGLVLLRIQMLLVPHAINIAILLFRVGVGLLLGDEVGMLFVALSLDLGGMNGRCEQSSCEGDLNHFDNLYYID